MNEPYWFSREEVLHLHELMLSHYGGLEGVRDENMLQSALAKPRHVFAYGAPNWYELAASYTVGIVLNHPFIDGNKRTGFMLGAAFLERNGFAFHAPEPDAVLRTLALAAGEMTEPAFAAWLQANTTPPKS